MPALCSNLAFAHLEVLAHDQHHLDLSKWIHIEQLLVRDFGDAPISPAEEAAYTTITIRILRV